jgi:hypothetical protein
MGKQIEAWNLSEVNDLTWPQVGVESVGPLVFGIGGNEYLIASIYVKVYDNNKFRRNCSNFLYWVSNDPAFSPSGINIYKVSQFDGARYTLLLGEKIYVWGGVRYLNGTWEAHFIDSYEE